MRISVAVLGLLASAILISPALSQESGPIDPGPYNTTVVIPDQPFHTPSMSDIAKAMENMDVLAEWNADQVMEVRQRCSVVVNNADRYKPEHVTFCRDLFRWVAAHPG